MAKGKVSRDGPGDEFSATLNPADPDVAIVGDASDGVEIEIDGDEDKNEDNWDLPANAQKPAPQSRDTRQTQDEPAADYDEEDSRLAYSDDPREQQEEDDKPSHRRRRNARRREAQTAAQAEIDGLKAQLQELGGVVRHLATGQSGLAANTLESQIVSLEGSLRVADEEMANAVAKSDGDTYTKAQRIRDEIVGRLWGLKNRHAQLLDSTRQQQPEQRRDGGQGGSQGGGQGQPQRQAPQIDPQVVAAVENHFDSFCDRFPWFDPQSPDADCNIVRSIDTELSAKGFRRETPHFWEQLERRMARYGLTPDRGSGEDDEQDDRRPPPRRQQMSNGGPRRPPTGNGRSTQNGRTGGGNSLSEVQVGMLRDEGLLEEKLSEADVAKRDRILAKWNKGLSSLRRQGVR